jgi:HEXXH motif-containing protein
VTARPLDVHRVSSDSLRAVAAGNAAETDLHLLRSAQRSQLLLVLRALLDRVDAAARRSRHSGGVPPARTAWELLCLSESRVPDAVEAVLGDPTVMAWALRLLRRLGRSSAGTPSTAPLWADLGQFQALAAAAALRAGVPCTLRVPAHRGMVWLPGAGMAGPVARRRWSEAEILVSGEGAVVRGELAQLALSRTLPETAPGWRPLRAIRRPMPGGGEGAGPGLWLDSVSPYRDFTRYPLPPDRSGDRRLQEWETRLGGAYDLLDKECPADAATLRALVRALVPQAFRTAEGGLVASASSMDAFGAVALSLPHDEPQTAAVLVHESRHQLLNALLGVVQLVRVPEDRTDGPVPRRLHYAPWRSDPRPVRGLLHGVFAFAGVAHFWRTHRGQVTGAEADRAGFEFAVLREQLGEALAALLTDEHLTEAGRLFVDEIARLVAAWQDTAVSAGPAALARHYCALRRAVWRARHLEIPDAAAERLAVAWRAGAHPPALPPSALRPRPELIRLDMFGPMARIRLSSPAAFARRRAGVGERAESALRAACAAVAGDAEEAVLRYAEWAAREPWDPEAWIGAVLVLPAHDRGAGASVSLDRPEVVVSVRRAVEAMGGGCPEPAALAEWLGGSAGRWSDPRR